MARPPKYDQTTPFVPPITEGYVVKVYDGDTITIAAKLPYAKSPLYRFQVRLAGIDSPEMHGLDKEKAMHSREHLHALVFGKRVKLCNCSTEKYGRILADVYIGQLHVNQWMLDNGLAVVYHGGKKNTEWKNTIYPPG